MKSIVMVAAGVSGMGFLVLGLVFYLSNDLFNGLVMSPFDCSKMQ